MAGEKKQITRSRISYSCQKCRQRKVKCDKEHPICGSCRKAGEECVYAITEPEHHTSHEPPTVEPGPAKRRKQSLTGSQTESTAHDGGSVTSVDLEDQLSQLSMLLEQLSNIVGITTTEDGRSNSLNSATPILSSVLMPEHQQLPRTSNTHQVHSDSVQQPKSTVRLVNEIGKGPAPNLEVISSQLDQLVAILRNQPINQIKQGVAIADTVVPDPVSTKTQALGDGPFLFVPNESQRNALFRSWLSSVYPVLPIVDPALTLTFYRAFRFWYTHGLEKGTPHPCEDYVPLIYAIYYAGVISLSPRGFRKWFPGIRRQQILRSLRRQFMKTLEAPAKLLSNPTTLAARITMWYMASRDSNEIGLTSTAAPLVRTAYSFNLHRERPNESLDPMVAEVRRRLWWETVNLDTTEAIASNVPPSINHHYCDTLMPSEIKDTKLSSPEASIYESALQKGQPPQTADDPAANNRSSIISTINLFMKAKTALAANARRLLNINLAAKPKTKEDMIEIRQILDDVDRFTTSNMDRIPAKGLPELDFTPNTGNTGQSLAVDHGSLHGEDLVSAEIDAICGTAVQYELWETPYILQHRHSMTYFHKWARIVLSMLVDQQKCFSYAPFLSNTKRKLWLSARMCALKHAHSFLRKFNCLATDLELERFRWTWSSLYQPMHACIMILLDSFENPRSQEAPRSRALLDQMLLLSSPSHGIVGGEDGLTTLRPLQEAGNEAFAMLMQLRAKAWHKAGLDPSLLWTEQDQIDVGVAIPLTETEMRLRSIREDTIYDGRNKTVQTQESTPYSYRPMLEQRAKEHVHPSLAGIPEDNAAPSGIHSCKKDIDSTTAPTGTQHMRPARPDQPLTPIVSSDQLNALHNPPPNNKHNSTSTGVYHFKPPSELYDVGELIRRIRSVQRSNQDNSTANDEETSQSLPPSSQLAQQIATTNHDLTNFLSAHYPVNINGDPPTTDLANRQQNPQPGPSLQAQTPSSHLASPTSSSSPTPTQEQDTNTDTSPPTSQPQPQPQPRSPPAPPTSTTPLPATTTSQTPARTNPESATARLVNMDFDWDKWDAIFGHLLDDGFGEADMVWEHETGNQNDGETEPMRLDG